MMAVKTCPDDEAMFFFLEGEGDSEVRRDIEAHLVSCVACKKRHAGLARVRQSLAFPMIHSDARFVNVVVERATASSKHLIAAKGASWFVSVFGSWRKFVWFALPLAPVAIVLVWLAAAPSRESGFAARGSGRAKVGVSPNVVALVQRQNQVRLLGNEKLDASDSLLFRWSNPSSGQDQLEQIGPPTAGA